MSNMLKNSEIRYQCLIENILDIIAELDLDGTFTYVSPQVYDIFGYYPEELIGVKFFKFIHPNDMSILKEIMKKTIKSKDTISIEFKVRHKAGYYVSVSMRGNLVNIDGKKFFIGVLKDITERKETEQKLKEFEEKYRTLYESSKKSIAMIDRYHTKEVGIIDLKNRKSGIEILDDFPWGTHFCLFYEKKEDLLDILIPYFKAGLENNEYCMWVTSELLNQNDAEKALRKAIPNFEQYLKRKQIEILPHYEWYFKNNEFNLQRVLNAWIEKLNYAINKGYDGLRVTGNTAWLESKDWKSFIDYEEEINKVISNYQMMAVCTYSLEKCGPYEILDVIHNHQFALLRREGKWEYFKSMEQIKAEQQLKESEEKYRLITESISDPLHVVDAELKVIYLNPAFIEWLKVLGLNHEIIGKTPAEAFPFIGENVTKEYQEFFKSKKEHFLEDSTVLNNKRIFTETKKIPVLKDGKVIQIITIVRDVTERKEIELKLRESEQKYRNLVETSSMGLLELDIRKGMVVYINPRLLEIVGYTQDELISNGMFYKAIYPDDYKKITKSDEDKDIEFRIINMEGKIKWLSGRTLHHYNEQGKLVYLRLWLQDITERKELEEIKSNLLTRISHEFKTPLISIKGFTDLVLSEYAEILDDKIISFLNKIKDGGNRLKSLINTFIESTQLDKDLVKLNLKQENLSKLVKLSLERMEGAIKMREHSVDLNIHDELNAIVDKERIESVFTNLLINSINYTPKVGNISIQSKIKGNSIIVSVKDNGIGLTKEEISKLFEPFGKIERYGKRWNIISEGMGMGLHISKEIIDLHGGKIWAESDGIDKGSKFSFSLPIVKN